MFKGIKRRVKTLLGQSEDLELRLEQHVRERLPFTLEEEELYLQLQPLTAALDEARSAARANRLHEASEHLLEHFHDRIRPLFFVHHSECELLRPGLLERPDETNRLLTETDRVLRHAFAPLGVEEWTFQSAIDWFSDFKGASWMFGPVEDLRLQIARDGNMPLPEGPLEATWEFNRHGHFTDLGRAYWLTGHERFASEFIVQMVDWSERNPALWGVNWMDPDTVAHRALNWLFSLHLFLKSAQLTSDVVSRLLRTLVVHGLALSRMVAGEPTLGAASSLYILAFALPELALSRRWLKQAAPAIVERAAVELNKDELHLSGSLAAHRHACEWLCLPVALHVLNQSRPPLGLEASALHAIEALTQVRPPNALVPELGKPLGSGLLGRGAGPSEHTLRVLALGALALDHGGVAGLCGEMPPELLWWFGPTAQSRWDALPAAKLPSLGGLYPAAGIAAVRDSWEPRASWVLFRGAPRQSDHDDLLSLCVTLDGEPLLVEPGSPAVPGSVYDAFASLSSHSAIRIGGEREPSRGREKLVAEQRKQSIYLRSGRDVELGDDIVLALTRELMWQPEVKRLAVRDRVEGPPGEVNLECNLLLAPHLDLLMRGDMGCLIRGRRLSARIHPVFPARFRYDLQKGRTQPFAGWVWSESQRPVPTQRLRYHMRVQLPATLYLWIGWEAGDAAAPRVEEMERIFQS